MWYYKPNTSGRVNNIVFNATIPSGYSIIIVTQPVGYSRGGRNPACGDER